MSRKQLPWDFRAKIDFFAFLASVGTKLLENDRVQIFRPPTPYFGGHIPFGTPRILSNSMSVIHSPFVVAKSEIPFTHLFTDQTLEQEIKKLKGHGGMVACS